VPLAKMLMGLVDGWAPKNCIVSVPAPAVDGRRCRHRDFHWNTSLPAPEGHGIGCRGRRPQWSLPSPPISMSSPALPTMVSLPAAAVDRQLSPRPQRERGRRDRVVCRQSCWTTSRSLAPLDVGHRDGGRQSRDADRGPGAGHLDRVGTIGALDGHGIGPRRRRPRYFRRSRLTCLDGRCGSGRR